MLLDDTKGYYMMCSVVTCYQELLHVVQCCYILPSVITSCAVLLDVTKIYYMLCSVGTCYLVLSHAVQYC